LIWIEIYAEQFAIILASARVLEKAGFVCEGRLRASTFKDGKRLDSFLYAPVPEAALRAKSTDSSRK
jgi:ribosomal-protein-alanine N-acetyltransferase